MAYKITDQSDHIDNLEVENRKLKERIEELELAVNEWREKADAELNINAKLHTETAHQAERIEELEGALKKMLIIKKNTSLNATYKAESAQMAEIAEQALRGKDAD